MRRLLGPVFIALAACGAPALANPEPAVSSRAVSLSPEELRQVMEAALSAGDLATAVKLATALLERDANDTAALIALAEAAALRGDGRATATYGRRAFAAARSRNTRFAGARLTALGHAIQGQHTRAQFWLRRAAQLAPDPMTRQSVGADYQIVRRSNPWSFHLSGGIRPSSNVNNGSAHATSPLLGYDVPFVLPGSARALSGGTVDGALRLSYRLHRDDHSETRLRFGLGGRAVWLSDAARQLAPEASGSDYAITTASIGLAHARAVGDWHLQTGADLLHIWRAGTLTERHLSVSADASRALGPGQLHLGLAHRRIWHSAGPTQAITSLSSEWRQPISANLQLTLGALAERTEASRTDMARSKEQLSIGLSTRRPFAGVNWGATLTHSWRSYDASSLVPSGRHEHTRRAQITAALPRAELYGFVPVITIDAFDTKASAPIFESTGVDFGLTFQSAF